MPEPALFGCADCCDPERLVLSRHRERCVICLADDALCAEAVADLATVLAVEPPSWLRCAVLEQIRKPAVSTIELADQTRPL